MSAWWQGLSAPLPTRGRGAETLCRGDQASRSAAARSGGVQFGEEGCDAVAQVFGVAVELMRQFQHPVGRFIRAGDADLNAALLSMTTTEPDWELTSSASMP